MWRANSLEKTLMLGKTEGRRRRRWQRKRWLDGILDSMDMSLSKFQEMVKNREAWRAAVPGAPKSDWTTNTNKKKTEIFSTNPVYRDWAVLRTGADWWTLTLMVERGLGISPFLSTYNHRHIGWAVCHSYQLDMTELLLPVLSHHEI